MTLFELQQIVISNMAEFADTFNMVNRGVMFFENEFELRAVYKDEIVPYIVFQEEGFTHYLSGKFIDKNKGFISNKATGKINRAIRSEELGLPIDWQEENEAFIENQNEILVELGGMKRG